MNAQREFDFSTGDFERIRNLLKQHTGITLADTKRELVYSRIARRLRKLGIRGFGQYCDYLESNPSTELQSFVNVMTTNLTAFFREPHHFRYLSEVVLPRLIQNRASSRRLRLWSAGCSTGEEAYSIAIVLRECIPNIERWDVKLLATDLDSNVLETARQGIYSDQVRAKVDAQRLRSFFDEYPSSGEMRYRVRDSLRRMIRFNRLNLLGDWPFKGPFDAIFCRNVVIYFDTETQSALFERMADVTAADGNLFIGHSETLFRTSDRFDLVDRTVYRKIR
ncbi:MAG: protein-glutamate O-methyltransferase CheR [Gammaproteobacteria bacterium]|nr:protein-glutamate O-methyltransferase CheR [Gammaproteobacteria bacterium]